MRRLGAAATAAALLVILPLTPAAAVVSAPSPSAGETFTFGAVGDNGADGPGDPGDSSSRTLQLIGKQRPAFVQSLGDLAYDASAAVNVHDGADWCTWTNAQIASTAAGAAIPYVIAAGNHEAQDAKPGFAIEKYTAAPACADPFAGRTEFPTSAATDAGKDSFYDYPSERPLLRMININPGLTYAQGGLRDYSRDGALYTWVEHAIDDAKARGEWVVLTYHVAYLNTGSDHGADMSTGYYAPTAAQFGDIFTLAVTKKVDLILNGHEHNYQRSHQLHLSAQCAAITHDIYDAACVTEADGSATAPYVRGDGPVQLVIGTGGHRPSKINEADGDRRYMVVADSGADNCGYVSFAVTAAEVTGTFENACSGDLADTFTIRGAVASRTADPPATVPTASPTSPSASTASFPRGFAVLIGAAALVILAFIVLLVLLLRRRRRH